MKQFVIIGNSAAGIAAAEAIRKADKQSAITIISDEDYPAYCRCLISYYLAGQVLVDKILYRPENFYKENNITLLLNKKVERVDPKKNRLVCVDKAQIPFDALLVATGSSPKFPEVKGIKKENVFGLRTIKNATEIAERLPMTKTACVLGGGLVGLKAAYALSKRNIDTKVIVKSKQVLSQMLDFAAAGFVQRRLVEHGVELVLGQDAVEIIGEGEIKAVKLDSGKAIGCELVVVGKGVKPNIELVKDTGIKINEGIIANNLLQTSIPNIYTAGDVCESFDITVQAPSINALWPVAVEQGRAAGVNIAGGNIIYDGSLGMNALEFFGLAVVSLGMYKVPDKDPSYEELVLDNPKEETYKKIVLKNNVIVGVILVKKISNSGVFLSLMRKKADVSVFKNSLLDDNFGYPAIKDLMPDKERIYV
ncbi:MAG: FAD-dependent oxidoreductase [Candidatus Omnitrophota bacterium]|nr:FAD-dependent oxidoreductase [Candidatus Omnitrophota bacterium]